LFASLIRVSQSERFATKIEVFESCKGKDEYKILDETQKLLKSDNKR
jgi:hypothetical protein